jgi:hypothetical protein
MHDLMHPESRDVLQTQDWGGLRVHQVNWALTCMYGILGIFFSRVY